MEINQEVLKTFIECKLKLINANIHCNDNYLICFNGSCECDKVIEMNSIIYVDDADPENQSLNFIELEDDKKIKVCLHMLNVSSALNDITYFKTLIKTLEEKDEPNTQQL